MSSVSAISVIDLANELCTRGAINKRDVYSISPSLPERVENFKQDALPQGIQEERLPEDWLIQLWQRVDQVLYPNIGLEVGSTVTPSAAGLLANWVSNCTTLGEALALFINNINLLNRSEHWDINYSDDEVIFTFTFLNQALYPHIAIDRSMSAMLAWAGYFCKQAIEPVRASFQYPQPSNVEVIKSCFGESIIFSAANNSVIIKREVLSREIQGNNPYVKSLLEQRAKKVQAVASANTWEEKTLGLLNRKLSQYSYIEAVCDELHISRSSLYRQLKSEGTSFSLLLKAVRCQQHQYAVEQQMSVQELCGLLGYKDISTYYKAKKRGDFNCALCG